MAKANYVKKALKDYPEHGIILPEARKGRTFKAGDELYSVWVDDITGEVEICLSRVSSVRARKKMGRQGNHGERH